MFLYRKSASNGFVWLIWSCPKTCKAKQKKKKNVSRPDFYEKESGRTLFFFFVIWDLFNISNWRLSLQITTLPQLGIRWSSYVK